MAQSPWSIAGEVIWTLFLIFYGFAITQLPQPWYFFVERDPALSQRVFPSTVSNTALAGLGFILPGLVLLPVAYFVVNGYHIKVEPPRWASKSPRAYNVALMWLTLCLGLAQAMGVALSGVNTIKVFASRPRPGFFALCNYAGYADALSSGDFSSYNSLTVAGAIGDLSKCRGGTTAVGSDNNLNDALRSFPSGHAGISFAGLVYLTLALRWALRVRQGAWFTPTAALCSAPMILACWIALTRIHDGKHNPVDIAVGAAIGSLGSYMGWKQLMSVGQRDVLSGLDDADGVVEALGHAKRRSSTLRPLLGSAPLTTSSAAAPQLDALAQKTSPEGASDAGSASSGSVGGTGGGQGERRGGDPAGALRAIQQVGSVDSPVVVTEWARVRV